MKQCSNCSALYSPRLDTCPSCQQAAAPEAWIRTRSRQRTRRSREPIPRPTKPKHHREEYAGREHPTDPTLKISREEVLAALSSEALPTVDETAEGLEAFDAYDIQDLVAPPPPDLIERLEKEAQPCAVEGFVDLASLEQLSEEVVGYAPDSEAIGETVSRMEIVRGIVERSRELAETEPAPEPSEPVPSAAAVVEPETWSLGRLDVVEREPTPAVPEKSSVLVPRLTGVSLCAIAGWALATGAPAPLVGALIVGACALLLLSGRSG